MRAIAKKEASPPVVLLGNAEMRGGDWRATDDTPTNPSLKASAP